MGSMCQMSTVGNEVHILDCSTKQIKVFNSFGDFVRDGCIGEAGMFHPVEVISVLEAGSGVSDLYKDGYRRLSEKGYSTIVKLLSSIKSPVNGTILRIKHSAGNQNFSQVLLVYRPGVDSLSRGDIDVALNETFKTWEKA